MLKVLGSAIGHAAGQQGCEKAPQAILNSAYLAAQKMQLEWDILEAGDHDEQGWAYLNKAAAFFELTSRKAAALTQAGKPFVSIGGDHSCAIGTWSGVASAISGDMGLLWVDAHMDAHTKETSPSGNIHGMPVAALLGYGDDKLTQIGCQKPKLKPEHLCLMGIRSYESGEAELLASLNVRIMFMEEILDRGLDACYEEAYSIVSKAPGGFGMSVDLDGFDVSDAPAVGTPVQNGIRAQQFFDCVQGLAQNPHFLALEIVEYNPTLSSGAGVTERALVDLWCSVFA